MKPPIMDQLTALKFAASLLEVFSDDPGDIGIYAFYGQMALEKTIHQVEPEYKATYMSDEMWSTYIERDSGDDE